MKGSQPKTLYVTDLDGTLMRGDKTLSEFTVNTLNQLIDQGMLITYATARTFESAWEITKDIHFQIPVITRNGTVFADQILKKETDISHFSEQAVSALKQLLTGTIERTGFVTAYFDGEPKKTYREGHLCPGLQKYIDGHANDRRMRAIGEDTDLFDGIVTYITLIAEKDELQPVYEKIRNAGDWECNFQQDTYGGEYWLEICPQNATKANAVLRCKEALSCDRVVVFGDSVNDLSMFAVADEACAVENGIEEVKSAATVIIPSNENDGVATYLLRLMVEEKIRRLFSKYPRSIYGFTSISYSSYAREYQSALVLAVPYGEQLTIKDYTEERFERGIKDAAKIVEKILTRIEEILNEHKVKYYIPPVAQRNEEELAAPFSFKYAAIQAGLGWIGKNDVVITEKYGPRVRLSAILIDSQFTYGQKITKSNCPDSCTMCVDSCPYHALHGVKWDIDTLRNAMIDYQLCNQKRSLYIESHGRKNACGLCMAACPIGI